MSPQSELQHGAISSKQGKPHWSPTSVKAALVTSVSQGVEAETHGAHGIVMGMPLDPWCSPHEPTEAAPDR